jgi:hypothetical protein
MHVFRIWFKKKIQVERSFLHLQHTRHELSPDGAGFRGFVVESANLSSDYFAYLCIPASETARRQKRMPIVDRSQLRRQTVETNSKINSASRIARLQGVSGLQMFYIV